MADGVNDLRLELRREGGHPADHDTGLDPVVQRGEMAGAEAADREADASDPVLIDLRPRDQVVDGAHIVVENDSRPGEPGSEDAPPNELLAGARAPIECRNPLG